MTTPTPRTKLQDDLRRVIGWALVEREGQADTLACALCSYFDCHMDCPDEPDSDETGWKEWVRERAEAAIELIAAEVDKVVQRDLAAREAELVAMKENLRRAFDEDLKLKQLVADVAEIRELKQRAEAAERKAEEAARDADRWKHVRRKVCFSGNGDGTATMNIINLPMAAKFPNIGEHEKLADETIDAAIAAKGEE